MKESQLIHRRALVSRSRRYQVGFLLGLLLIIVASACDSTRPSQGVLRDSSSLNMLHLDQASPGLVSDTVSFYAVAGEDRGADIFFADSMGQPGERLLHFEVGQSSLDRYPGGQRFHQDDSVLITIRVTDPSTLAFTFEPSGLLFKTSHPALLTIGYGHALSVFTGAPQLGAGAPQLGDGDGESHDHWHRHHDEVDDSLAQGGPPTNPHESDLAVWVQERTGQPYLQLQSQVDVQAKEVEADVPGFSKYAVAY